MMYLRLKQFFFHSVPTPTFEACLKSPSRIFFDEQTMLILILVSEVVSDFL